jgi:nucleoside-diphosphate-sugar epimerase
MLVGVTGGTGFIGRHLVTSLVKHNAHVRVLTRRPEILGQLWPKGDVEPWAGDLTVPETLRGFAHSARVVYHLAGEVRDANCYDMVNVTGTKNLLKACLDNELKKFVHLSSVATIGASSAGVVDESTPCHPKNAYERSKLAGEQVVLSAFKESQLPVTVIRPTIVFGEGTNQNHDSLVSLLSAIKKGCFRFVGTGKSSFNYIYIGDVVRACLFLAETDKATGKVYIVSDSCSLRAFVGAAVEFMDVRMPGSVPTWLAYTIAIGFEMAAKLTHFSPPLTVGRVRALTSRVVYSSDKLREELGFSPPIGWREGLRRTLEWYNRNRLLPPTRDK